MTTTVMPLASTAGFGGAPAPGPLGGVVVNPYGKGPLAAIIGLHGKSISELTVAVHGKGADGVAISDPVGAKTLLTHDGIPVFGLYQKHANRVTVDFSLGGKKQSADYTIRTGAIENK